MKTIATGRAQGGIRAGGRLKLDPASEHWTGASQARRWIWIRTLGGAVCYDTSRQEKATWPISCALDQANSAQTSRTRRRPPARVITNSFNLPLAR